MEKNCIWLLLLCLCFCRMQGEDGCRIRLSADCRPLRDALRRQYYAYGTGGTVEGEGFACFSSDDLKNWTREGQALSAADSYGTVGIRGLRKSTISSRRKVLLVLLHRRAYLRGNGRYSPRPVPSGGEASLYGMRRALILLSSSTMTARLTFISCVSQMAMSFGWQK